MILAVASFKGGTSKTTSAMHLSAWLSKRGKTLLADGDPNQSASTWAARGSMPFTVLPAEQADRAEFEHIVIDTPARPSQDDLAELAAGSDLLVIPATPDALSLDALMLTLAGIRNSNYAVLLTITPPKPSKAADEMRAELKSAGWSVLDRSIRRLVAYQKAALQGCLVYEVRDPRAHLGWDDFKAVGEEIIKWRRSRNTDG